MDKIRIRLPATIMDFGPGFYSFGLAIGVYLQVEFIPRTDDKLIVEIEGEGAQGIHAPLQHPVILGMSRFFQHMERSISGFKVIIQNDIPQNAGLAYTSVLLTAGIAGANNLLGGTLSRHEIVAIAAKTATHPNAAITTLLGGLTTYARINTGFRFRSLPLTPFRIVLVIPSIEGYQRPVFPKSVVSPAVLYNMQRIPLVQEALHMGDLNLLAEVLDDKLLAPHIRNRIPHFDDLVQCAKEHGALAVATSGGGPTFFFITEHFHEEIASALKNKIREKDMKAKVLVVPIDTQGIVVNMAQLPT